MATPPFEVEEQTDEDFFDKLVDDDIDITDSNRGSTVGIVDSDEAKALENLGIGDVGTVAEEVTEEKDQPKNLILPSSEVPDKDSSVAEECISSISSNCAAFDPTTADTTSDSTTSKSSVLRGTSIKEVQWSAFNSDLNKQDGSAFGSYSDFFSEITDNSTMLDSNPSPTARTMEEPIADFQSSSTYSDQQTSQNYGEVTQSITNGQDIYDIQYWESLYPGWRYDPATGQWHQIEGYDVTRASQEGFQDKSDTGAGVNFSDQTSEVSYLQQTAQSVVGTIAESGTISSISNWSGASQVTDETEYPSHMIFDPQYPGWYYDSIAQEWCSLESHVSASQVGSAVHNQQTEVTTASSDSLSGEVSQAEQYNSQSGQNQGGTWGGSATYYPHQNTWQPEAVAKSEAIPMGNFYGSTGHVNSYVDHQSGLKPMETASSYEQANHGFDRSNGGMGFQSFASTENVHQFKQQTVDQNQLPQFSSNYYGNQSSVSSLQDYQTGTSAYNQTSYTPIEGKSSSGRPSHALVSFGFGGKLVIMKSDSSYGSSSSFGSQDSLGGSVSILNLAEVVLDKTDATGPGCGACDYFHVLCQQSFPGPLVGGNVASKDLNKWVDERIAKCPSAGMDLRKGEVTRLLLSLLKISCQQYGKLRSPFGGDSTLLENDSPELAVTKLFASARKNSDRVNEYGSFPHCMQNVPSETQTRTTAVEVQNLLVSGRRKEALQRAHEGQLWGPALVLAAQLGEQFYVDTVKQMAHHQFMPGSPLRTLCLLIAKEPADVFSADTSVPDSVIPSQQRTKIRSNGMLDGWEENLAIITGNRTKGDELVIIHLGDCLWRERDEITAAHTCYLVAEANFESYSDSARLCLVGADHLKHPRTFASPEAIQRTELYEYSKVLGNSQYILLPFQPYKLIYAYMLAEVGKVADSLRYCQAILKVLKSPARAPEVETWKLLVSSLEERIRTHQQGGYSTNLAPGKLVGKLFTSIDRSISRMIGVPPPVPSTSQNSTQSSGRDTHSMVPKVATSQSTMAMSSLMPSASMEPISEWTGGGSRMTKQNRSISEPDFARSPKQVDQSKESGLGGKPSGVAGPSRFGRIGSQLLQKTMGWVSKSRTDRQAKLGKENKFYYDEKLKKWVEEGVEPPAEEAALPPPPTTTAFQNGTSDYNINSAFQSQGPSLPANGGPESRNPNPPEYSSGIPPIPPSSNQFSARGRMGVRSRYVDTFNKGGVAPTNLFQSPSAPVAKPAGGAKFFVPAATGSSEPSKLDPSDGIQEIPAHEHPVASAGMELLIPSVSVPSIQRFPSMDNITPIKNSALRGFQSENGSLYSHSRAASWSGSSSDMKSKTTEIKSLGEVLGMPPSAFMSNGSSSSMYPSSASPLMNRCGSSGDELQEVEL